MSDADKQRAVHRVVLSMSGTSDSLDSPGDDNKYNPVGMRSQTCTAECTFENVEDNQHLIVLMQAPGHMFAYDRLRSKGNGEVTSVKKTYMPKPMHHGQMLVTLSWGEEPSDLDLFVVAPAKHGTTQIGGGKPALAAAEV